MPRPAPPVDTICMTRRVSLLIALTMVALMLPVGGIAEAGSSCWSHSRQEKRFAAKINKARSNKGFGSVKLDPELSRVARHHTKEMVGKKTLHHTSLSTLGRRVTNWVTLGENVGVGETVTSLHRAFMNSPTHRSNVLYATYNHVGVGTRRAGGKLWVTVVFEAQTNPGTTLKMPSC